MSSVRDSTEWTDAEDRLLMQLHASLGSQWSIVAESLPGRSSQQCASRWRERRPRATRGEWTRAEDAALAALVARYGCIWGDVSRHLPGRTEQQCSARWRRHHHEATSPPELAPAPGAGEGTPQGWPRGDAAWGSSDDLALRDAVGARGNGAWAAVARAVGGKTASQCRARWGVLAREASTPASAGGGARHVAADLADPPAADLADGRGAGASVPGAATPLAALPASPARAGASPAREPRFEPSHEPPPVATTRRARAARERGKGGRPAPTKGHGGLKRTAAGDPAEPGAGPRVGSPARGSAGPETSPSRAPSEQALPASSAPRADASVGRDPLASPPEGAGPGGPNDGGGPSPTPDPTPAARERPLSRATGTGGSDSILDTLHGGLLAATEAGGQGGASGGEGGPFAGGVAGAPRLGPTAAASGSRQAAPTALGLPPPRSPTREGGGAPPAILSPDDGARGRAAAQSHLSAGGRAVRAPSPVTFLLSPDRGGAPAIGTGARPPGPATQPRRASRLAPSSGEAPSSPGRSPEPQALTPGDLFLGTLTSPNFVPVDARRAGLPSKGSPSVASGAAGGASRLTGGLQQPASHGSLGASFVSLASAARPRPAGGSAAASVGNGPPDDLNNPLLPIRRADLASPSHLLGASPSRLGGSPAPAGGGWGSGLTAGPAPTLSGLERSESAQAAAARTPPRRGLFSAGARGSGQGDPEAAHTPTASPRGLFFAPPRPGSPYLSSPTALSLLASPAPLSRSLLSSPAPAAVNLFASPGRSGWRHRARDDGLGSAGILEAFESPAGGRGLDAYDAPPPPSRLEVLVASGSGGAGSPPPRQGGEGTRATGTRLRGKEDFVLLADLLDRGRRGGGDADGFGAPVLLDAALGCPPSPAAAAYDPAASAFLVASPGAKLTSDAVTPGRAAGACHLLEPDGSAGRERRGDPPPRQPRPSKRRAGSASVRQSLRALLGGG